MRSPSSRVLALKRPGFYAPVPLALLAPMPATRPAGFQPAATAPLLESAAGNAEVKRTTERLRFLAGLEAEAATAELGLPPCRNAAAVRHGLAAAAAVSEAGGGSPVHLQQPRSKDRPELWLKARPAPERSS